MSEEATLETTVPSSSERLSDFTWYSRLLVWVGALVLLVEAVTGISVALFTVVAVLLLAFGLLAFLGGLVVDSLPARPATALPAALIEEPPPEPVISEETSAPSQVAQPAVDAEPAAELPPVTTAPKPSTAAGALTATVTVGDELVGKPCLACQEPLRAGQTAAACPVCGSPHHATCWVGNRFHCARQGCDGHGSLIEPATPRLEPQGGPSKP